MTQECRTQLSRRAGALMILSSFLLGILLAGGAFAKAPETEDEKILYFVGVILGQQPPFSTLTTDEVSMMAQGLRDSLAGSAIELDATVYGDKVQTFAKERIDARVAEQKKKSEGYLKDMAEKKGAKKTDSGLIIFETEVGKGESPKTTDTVKVHYHGTLADGTVFDSSVERGEPATFPLNRVIPCWTEGVALMKIGGKATLVCPSDIAYGDRGAPPKIEGGAALTFDVELLEIVDSQSAIPSIPR